MARIAAVPDPPEQPVKRGPGRPRKDGTPAQPRPRSEFEPPRRSPGRPRKDGSPAQSKNPDKDTSLLAAAYRSERAALVKLRDMAAEQLDKNPSGAVFAAIAKQFRECDAAVREFDARAKRRAEESEDEDESDGWDEEQL